jgi:ankyrin repeat protein
MDKWISNALELEEAITKLDANAVAEHYARTGKRESMEHRLLHSQRPAIDLAISLGSLDIVKVLVEQGGIHLQDTGRSCTGTIPIDEACKEGKEEILDYLIKKTKEAGLPLSERHWLNKTPLMYAARHGQLGCVRRLMLEGPSNTGLNSTNGGGRTALQYAMEGGHVDVVRELLLVGGASLLPSDKIEAVRAENPEGSLECIRVHEVRGSV